MFDDNFEDIAMSINLDDVTLFDDLDPMSDDTAQTVKQFAKSKAYAHNTAKRQLLMNEKKRSLAELLPTYPGPDVDMYILSAAEGKEQRMGQTIKKTGFDFGDFIFHAIDWVGVNAIVYVSTWVMSR